MIVTVDRMGRVVIPKPLRTLLGLTPDTPLELIVDGAGLRLDPVVTTERAVEYVDGLPVLAAVDGAALTDDDVRSLRLDAQR